MRPSLSPSPSSFAAYEQVSSNVAGSRPRNFFEVSLLMVLLEKVDIWDCCFASAVATFDMHIRFNWFQFIKKNSPSMIVLFSRSQIMEMLLVWKPHNAKVPHHIDQYKLIIKGHCHHLTVRNFQLFIIFNSALFLVSILK